MRTEILITDSDTTVAFGYAGGNAISPPEFEYRQEMVDVLFIVEKEDKFFCDFLGFEDGELEDAVKEAIKENGESELVDYTVEIEPGDWYLTGHYTLLGIDKIKQSDRGALVVSATLTENQHCGYVAAGYE